MPLTIRLTDTSVPQAWILEDASPFNDGIMTRLQAAQLAALVAGGGGGGGALAAGIENYTGGLGTVVIPVAFLSPLASANYVPAVDLGFAGASTGTPPQWWPSDLTVNGFNINLQADPGFDMQAFWTINKPTQ